MITTLKRQPTKTAQYSSAQFLDFGDQLLYSQSLSELGRQLNDFPQVVDLRLLGDDIDLEFHFMESICEIVENEFNDETYNRTCGWKYVCRTEGFRKFKMIIWNE